MTDERLKEIEALATAALTTTTGPNPMSRDSLRRGNRDDARIILELVTEVRRLKKWKDEVLEAQRQTMEEPCREDERHCACVPLLRAEGARLKAEVRRLRQ